ncbi:MAG: CRTAC1 family protein [Planctomycetes bacterium]|nr:CRTAC1 family protein [Planctomycetota bacterium]
MASDRRTRGTVLQDAPRERALFVPLLIAVTLATGAGCRKREEPVPERPKGPIQLSDVSRETGIDFVHTDGSSGRRYIIEPMCAGLALFDYNNDGLIDIYFLNGAPLPGTVMSEPPRNALYRNLGGWRFVDVTLQAGVGDTGFGLGVTAADFDNDGFCDLYLNNSGPNVLYRNNGDGTFTDVTEHAGVGNGDLVGAGTAFLDMDADGDLDLYVANYLKFDVNEHVQRTVQGFPSYPSPRDFEPVADTLFRNDGDGTFTDVSEASGIRGVAGTGMGMVCADADDDGDTDVFVLNDFGENFFFRNDGAGNFEEVGLLVGLANDGFGQQNASMGVDCGDLNNDGLLDFFMTDYQTELPVFYRNLGNGRFEDATHETQAGISVFPYVNWGTGIVDFDNDGHRDIYIANGHTEDNVDLYDSSTAYRVRDTVLRNTGDGRFRDVSDTCGDGLDPVLSSRGTGFDDLDNDGDVDGVVLISREKPVILRNENRNGNHWLQIQLRGTSVNRDAVGSKVTVVAGDLTLVDEVHSGRGYQSHHGMRLHFGLGKRNSIDRVEIRWLGGTTEVLRNVTVDQLLTIIEGRAGERTPGN